MRSLTIFCLLSAYTGCMGAQTEQPGVFHEQSTGITLRYPIELVVRDAEKSMDEGHIAIFGSMRNAAKEHELSKRCMKPILLVELPDSPAQKGEPSGENAATLLMFEFVLSKECKAGFKYKADEAVAGGVAQAAIQLPGATPLSRPLYFDFGKQKLHASFAAFGLQNTSPDQPHALIATTAMLYHGHVLGWLMSSTQLNTFNDLTKSSIELDDGKKYALVPFNLDDRLRLPINVVP